LNDTERIASLTHNGEDSSSIGENHAMGTFRVRCIPIFYASIYFNAIFTGNLTENLPQNKTTMTTQKEIGERGERVAAVYLEDLGYTIKARNWRCGHKELDIVAVDGYELVIVEVKARTSDQYEHPSEAVTNQKIRHIVNAAEAYIQFHDIDLETRFDVITVIFYGEDYELEHFKEAFFPLP